MTQATPDETPDNPAGEFASVADYDEKLKGQFIEELANAPAKLRDAVQGLSAEQLELPYRNWTIRQIVHHLADSHLHSYIRFKWTLTEDQPTIKAYEEADWVLTEDSRVGDIEPSLHLLEAMHGKWVQALRVMTPEQFGRQFIHPQSGNSVSLWDALNYYPWHCRHHTSQIMWLREHRMG